MKSFAFAAIIGFAAALNTAEFEYMQYLAQFNKVHNEVDEFRARMENFNKANEFIKEHNATESNYTVGHNQFSDWYPTEYQQLLGYKKRGYGADGGKCEQLYLDESANADSVNWVEAGAVTPVKD